MLCWFCINIKNPFTGKDWKDLKLIHKTLSSVFIAQLAVHHSFFDVSCACIPKGKASWRLQYVSLSGQLLYSPRKWRRMPDRQRKRIPDHRSNALKGYSCPSLEHGRSEYPRLSKESKESRDEAPQRGMEELYQTQCEKWVRAILHWIRLLIVEIVIM